MTSDPYWAVVEHARTWIAEDGPFRLVIEKQNGRIDGVTLRRIAIAYNVSRGVNRRDLKADTSAEAIARLINKARPWPPGLSDRARRCLKIAQKLRADRHTDKLQASAITKFSWFSEPADWTVYDRFVARAIGATGKNTETRVLKFYATLEARGFPELARRVQADLDDCAPLPLVGARVLDKLMMLHGARDVEPEWAKTFVFTAQAFLEALPSAWRASVERAAKRVEESIDPTALLRG